MFGGSTVNHAFNVNALIRFAFMGFDDVGFQVQDERFFVIVLLGALLLWAFGICRPNVQPFRN